MQAQAGMSPPKEPVEVIGRVFIGRVHFVFLSPDRQCESKFAYDDDSLDDFDDGGVGGGDNGDFECLLSVFAAMSDEGDEEAEEELGPHLGVRFTLWVYGIVTVRV